MGATTTPKLIHLHILHHCYDVYKCVCSYHIIFAVTTSQLRLLHHLCGYHIRFCGYHITWWFKNAVTTSILRTQNRLYRSQYASQSAVWTFYGNLTSYCIVQHQKIRMNWANTAVIARIRFEAAPAKPPLWCSIRAGSKCVSPQWYS